MKTPGEVIRCLKYVMWYLHLDTCQNKLHTNIKDKIFTIKVRRKKPRTLKKEKNQEHKKNYFSLTLFFDN